MEGAVFTLYPQRTFPLARLFNFVRMSEPAVTREEGCLSLPGLSEPVKRFEHVRLNWLDENFEEHEKEFKGFASRIIQHEFDHLLGTVYTDRVAPLRRSLIRTKLNNLAKGKVRCGYRVKTAPSK